MNSGLAVMLKIAGALVICATVAGLVCRFWEVRIPRRLQEVRMPLRTHAPMTEDFSI